MKTYSFLDPEPAEILRAGGIVCFPTETVYGIACRFDREDSYERLNRIKRRPPEKPYTMMLSEVGKIDSYAYTDDIQKALISRFMPGQVTFILNRKECVPDFATSGSPRIGIRVPEPQELRDFLSRVGVPLLVPSANRSGEKPAGSAREVEEIFGDEIDCVIDAAMGGGVPSTVVLLAEGRPVLLRAGAVPFERIIEEYEKELRS